MDEGLNPDYPDWVSSLVHCWLIQFVVYIDLDHRFDSTTWERIKSCRHPNKNAYLLKETISLVLVSSNLDRQLSMFGNESDSKVLVPGIIKMGSSILMQSQMSTTVPQSRAAQRMIETDVQKWRFFMNCHFLTRLNVGCLKSQTTAFSGDALLAKFALFQSTEACWRRPSTICF